MKNLKVLGFYIFLSSLHLSLKAFDIDECPEVCHCKLDDGLLILVDCSRADLSEMPVFPDNQIHMLDLSNNQITQFPSQLNTFEALQYLDLSDNQITRLKSDALTGLVELRYLNLSKNNISSWTAINPRTFLEPAVNLLELSLSGNPISSFSTNDENLLLISSSLRMLDLSHCKITKVSGQQVIEGMKVLRHLNLASNQIRSVSDMNSESLTALDLSHNRLTTLSVTMLANLPSLTFVDFSGNSRISLRTKQKDEVMYVFSDSLKKIDLSYCNLDTIELEGFPGLTNVKLKRNLIQELTKESFSNSRMIEFLDISFNSITTVDANTFKKLKHLRSVDFSFNNIGKIERDTFKENEQLIDLDLSRNRLNRFKRLNALNLKDLNMTWNQIVTIDADAFSTLPNLVDLDLSGNLIIEFPDSLSSKNLQNLDLSMNRLTHISLFTFNDFPEIQRIDLSGNRLTTPLRKDHFNENVFLDELLLGDNPWNCNCGELFQFYIFISEHPSKVRDLSSLRCQSPEDVFGRSWESACYLTWYPQSKMGTSEKIWTFFMISVVVFCGCWCVVLSIKRGIEGRRLTRREEERIRNLEEARELQRENRMRMQQVAMRDAPDPRESRPPCYSDAIRMPRLDGFASLNELRNKNKVGKKDNEEEEEVPLRRNRCRSEEVISMRETRAPPRVHPFEVEQLDRQTFIDDDNETTRNSNVILNLENSPGGSRSRSKARKIQRTLSATESSEFIGEFQQSTNSIERSPYSKRLRSLQPSSSNHVDIVDDHFQEIHSESESDESGGFVNIDKPESKSKNSSSDDIVIVDK